MPWTKHRKSGWRRMRHELFQFRYWLWVVLVLVAVAIGFFAAYVIGR